MTFVVSVNAANPTPKVKKPTVARSIPSPTSLPLPDEIIVNCFAYIPRCDYPSLSLVSKTFNRLITSIELNIVRSLFQRTENVLYVALRFSHEEDPIWYTLNQKPYKNKSNSCIHKLVPLPSCPSLPCWGSSVIAIGHKIYVFGGCINGDMNSNVFVIDCLHGTFQFLPSMRVPRGCAAFGIVDGKIYVIGGYNKADSLDNWVEVFDLEKQTWESFSGLCNEELSKITLKSVVMNKKIYIMDRGNGIVFDPKKGVWERDFLLDRDWVVGSCVIDNMLYTFGFDGVKRVYRVRVYDPSVRVWSFVKGIEDIPKMDGTLGSRMANHGGKLVILLNLDKSGRTELWCIKIALERRGQQGEIWGKILWYNLVLTLENSSTIVECFDITI
ncbi:unnamed protein product [Arabidopsis thaliana]|uniref:F-box domain-containing protein n=1 Tax=Arabidopsis thaliana TaxID=3702 RepID=A0A654FBD5_ARATH|nr:unnamed protein product [Arabidopsis thaliana]